MRVTSADGVDIELHDFGGEGPPLLISHATGFLAAVYRPMADTLRDRYHVWAVDYRGHGDSAARPDGDQGWHGMTADLLACLDALAAGGHPGPVVGFGHSMGAAVMLHAARRRPGAFGSIVAYEPIVPPPSAIGPMQHEDNNMSSSARRRRPTFASRTEAFVRYASRPPLNQWRTDVLWRYVEEGFRDEDDGTVTLKCPPAREAATFEGVVGMSPDDLAAIATPVLVMIGGLEAHMPPALFGAGVARGVRHGELVEYPTFGHFGPFQDPLRIALDVTAFAERAARS